MKATFILLFLALNFSVPAAQNEKPNIVILFADDMGYADLSCYGSDENNTPVLDKLAMEGMRFTDFYAGAPVCSPSRASLLTGRFAVRAGLYSWVSERAPHKMHLHRDEVTIAELLKQQGYSTAHIGKWHLGFDLTDGSGPRPTPGDQGFDYWFATINNAGPSHHNPNNFVRNGKEVGEIKGYSSHIVVKEAGKWLDEHREPGKPFFLNLWFHEPHQPVAAPEVLNQYHEDTNLPAYYGCIENMDLAIGHLLKKLEQTGMAENTFIIFMSDNGSYRWKSNGHLRAGKTKIWEGGIRVSAIIKWPGHIKPGTVEKTPAAVFDMLPTFAEISGAELPGRTIDGVSLAPLFKGKKLKREKPMYWFYSPSRPAVAIRDGEWNMVADPEMDIPTDNMFREEWIGMVKETDLTNFRLYNLQEDPGQENDLSEDKPKVFKEMKEKLLKLHRDVVEEAIDWRYFEF